MNKILKKMLLFVLTLSMTMSMVTIAQSDVKAASLKLNDTNSYSISREKKLLNFSLSKAGTLSISVKATSQSSCYFLYDNEGKEIWSVWGKSWNWNLGMLIETYEFDLNVGDYTFCFFENYDSDKLNNITIKTSFKSSKESFIESLYGNNNTMDTADTIKFNTKYYGFISETDYIDNYKFSLSQSDYINIKITSYIPECKLYIYDSEGIKVWSDTISSDSNTGKVTANINGYLNKGTYILCFSPWWSPNTGAYNFEIEKEVSKFYVKYYSNGGSGSMSRTTVEYGKNVALRDNSFKKTGYHLTGWTMYRESDKKWLYTNGNSNKWYKEGNQPSGYKKKVYKDEAVVSKLSSKNNDVVRAYAVWKRNTYTVKYLKNGGKGSMSNTTVTYGVSKSLRSNSFKRSGYKFVGWTCNRASDNKWYYSNGTKYGWYKEGKQPKGYKKVVYKNKAKIAKTTAKNKDTVYMVARWK